MTRPLSRSSRLKADESMVTADRDYNCRLPRLAGFMRTEVHFSPPPSRRNASSSTCPRNQEIPHRPQEYTRPSFGGVAFVGWEFTGFRQHRTTHCQNPCSPHDLLDKLGFCPYTPIKPHGAQVDQGRMRPNAVPKSCIPPTRSCIFGVRYFYCRTPVETVHSSGSLPDVVTTRGNADCVDPVAYPPQAGRTTKSLFSF
ncbi:uncharacterized protein LY79DRAFT_110935 [Colletotrichum navitas]|uniref:Uncharacterized protein n=1 Tax=Colletotrichum navitas TaxID=681940 RepID=A0AAD8Q3L7_9PEZI|nr:uncharacterized protein LY79DRAFT_110935 [Colletotrichum navitas]KAK1595321.1 hypothetical protein LY79DRAFT_110935 [Colletotrichum navitas]